MQIMIILIILFVILGCIWLQVFLSMKENKWFGLILPSISFLYSMKMVFGIVVIDGMVGWDIFTLLVSIIFYANFSTLFLIAIYFYCRNHKRWSDFSFHEQDGECLADVQKRNLSALAKVLKEHENENIVIATHGTALSTILNYYDNNYNCDDFLKIIDYLPYVIRLDFDDVHKCVSKIEEFILTTEPNEAKSYFLAKL